MKSMPRNTKSGRYLQTTSTQSSVTTSNTMRPFSTTNDSKPSAKTSANT